MSFRGKAELDQPLLKSGAEGGHPLVVMIIGDEVVHLNTFTNSQVEVKG
jgi:hypothetical protein